jgi:hypothetical protein
VVREGGTNRERDWGAWPTLLHETGDAVEKNTSEARDVESVDETRTITAPGPRTLTKPSGTATEHMVRKLRTDPA